MTKVVILEFKRCPKWFFDCIVSGDAMGEHRAAMLTVGRPCVFAEGGAKMLVKPEEVRMRLKLLGISAEQIIWEVSKNWRGA
jgi:hypothetical protein